MESTYDYDRKFEELKQYIPFLERLINKLESNSSSSENPRQAQLDKIRSLRDLLLNNKKRMKMENLEKCEQVLINLHAKVEERDSFAESKSQAESMDSKNKEKSNLEIVRNKLKSVVKLEDDADTLPEIARANDVEQYCTPGSKEPALFQRRPNMPSESQSAKSKFERSSISPPPQHRRNYTRVLVSPDQSPKRWSFHEQSPNKPLFSRRSPTRKKSPVHSKREKKKSKSSKSRKTKDLNITLNVPEESLNSLNTKDILSRIITCSDGDVDINTLRELRSQILGELKQTGANNDISDLILKSYNKKTKGKYKRREEVEEGEISDSESEAIESIYGSLIVMDKDKKSSTHFKSVEGKSNQPRKIQICFVLNSEKDVNKEAAQPSQKIDISEFELLSESETKSTCNLISIDSDASSSSPQKKHDELNNESITDRHAQKDNIASLPGTAQSNDVVTVEEDLSIKNKNMNCLEQSDKEYAILLDQTDKRNDMNLPIHDSIDLTEKDTIESNRNFLRIDNEISVPESEDEPQSVNLISETATEKSKSLKLAEETLEQPTQFIANFYKPIEEHQNIDTEKNNDLKNNILEKDPVIENNVNPSSSINKSSIEKVSDVVENDKESSQIIPLLNEPTLPPKATKDVLSEIDILQALKNEILSDTITGPVSEKITPALHQPKLTKVACAQEVAPKKRISIEKYKAKSATSNSLFLKQQRKSRNKIKKQSLKLTEKECERFNFPKRLSIDDDDDTSDDDLLSSDKEDSLSYDDIYGDLAPRSPDNEQTNINNTPPIIIPVDPVKTNVVSTKKDVDMRNLLPLLSPPPQPIPPSLGIGTAIPSSPAQNIDKRPLTDTDVEAARMNIDRNRVNCMDPRMRRDVSSSVKDSPNPHASVNPDKTPRSTSFPNMALMPNMTPNMTPSYMPSMTPIMTPNARSFEMTPSHQTFELEDFSSRKHVYAPTFCPTDNREREMSVPRDSNRDSKNDSNSGRRTRWENKSGPIWDDSNSKCFDDTYRARNNENMYRDKKDSYSKTDCPTTPIPSFGWSECPSTPASAFGRQEAPMTPSNQFGRSECPSTPIHPFGRSDNAVNSSSGFGRQELPMTPSHPFGRSEYPSTLSHQFSRSDCPSTPIHSFGRVDCPSTPSHPFGRSEVSSYNRNDVPVNSSASKYIKDPRLYRRQRENETNTYGEKDRYIESERSHNRGESYKSNRKPYSGTESFRYERERGSNYYSNDRNIRQFDRDRRETSVCSSLSKDSDSERLYTRNRGSRYDERSSTNNNTDPRNYPREKSTSRMPENIRSTSRAPSIGRSSGNDRYSDNRVSFKSDSGRSLTINTSVNSTFQDFLDKPIQVFDYSFDARKKRAASVGRFLVRENSVGRMVTTKQKDIDSSNDNRINNNRFKRACSMGRELTKNHQSERSFKDIKADFESFKLKLNKSEKTNKFTRASSVGRESMRENRERTFKHLKADFESFKSKLNIDTNKPKKQDSPRSRIDIFKEKQRETNPYSKNTYSPRNNYRDPRTRREQYHADHHGKYKIDRRGIDRSSRDQHKTGIVYSSDNIAKGTIMGSGFGVKNYKIPKIKRVSVEKEQENKQDKNEQDETSEKKAGQDSLEGDKKLCNAKIVDKPLTDPVSQEKNDKKLIYTVVDDSSLKQRSTRSKSKILSAEPIKDGLVTKVRKSKKAVIHDSDSDPEINTEGDSNKTHLNTTLANKKIKDRDIINTSLQQDLEKKTNEETLDSSFGLDDMEIFPENIGSDPVIENINALIADLDNDIDTSKISDNFTTDIEKMMESIESPEGDSLGDISEVIENDLNDSQQEIKQKVVTNNLFEKSKISSIDENLQRPDAPDSDAPDVGQSTPELHSDNALSASDCVNSLENKAIKNNETKEKVDPVSTAVNEAIVSTTEIDQNFEKNKENKTLIDEDDHEQEHSVPDSTINKNNITEKAEEVIADSTNEIHCELSSDVSSTNGETSKKELETHNSTQIDTNSIGSLLSILQDKSKIKELLAILGDSSTENDKIKKKLERLSEIVSDEDDNNINEDQSKIIEKKESCDTNIEKIPKNRDTETDKDENKIEEDKKVGLSCQEAERDHPNVETTKTIPATENLKKDSLNVNAPETSTQLDEKVISEKGESNENTSADILVDVNKTKDETIDTENKSEQNTESAIENDNGNSKMEDEEQEDDEDGEPISNIKKKKSRKTRSRKSGRFKKPVANTNTSKIIPSSPQINKPIRKRRLRELAILQEDIKEMFMSDDILNATGIRMCRLAKMTQGKDEIKKDDSNDSEPIGLKKVTEAEDNVQPQEKIGKKVVKSKNKVTNAKPTKTEKLIDHKTTTTEPDIKMNNSRSLHNFKPGPKSKTKHKRVEQDPYEFDTDSITDTNTTKESNESSSDSENDSLVSSQSFGSSEVLSETKKKVKRKRCAWQSGVIKPKNRKKKEQKQPDTASDGTLSVPSRVIPDMNCFTDKMYCFDKDVTSYECRLCLYTGEDIVNHYKKQHPHYEIPLSRMNPQTAEIAIKQCEEPNFQILSKIPSKKYVCRFCHKEFGRNKAALETFFWHVVSYHTGEYKHLCSECVNVTRCPFNLDIPPPPKDTRGQLIGYICGKCNFTQVSLENLKTHVIAYHNDEQTEVYTINLAKLSKKAMIAMLHHHDSAEHPRVLRNRSLRSNQSTFTENSDNRDDCSEAESIETPSEADTISLKEPKPSIPKTEPHALKSKLTFENDEPSDETSVKMELEEPETGDNDEASHFDDTYNAESLDTNPVPETETVGESEQALPELIRGSSDDIMDYPHFKLYYTASGSKEYVCCINGNDNHYKTTLLISMKKHIQSKHSEKWDGYCCLCKVIVTLQGVQSDFRDCLTHFLDKHMDDFPILEIPTDNTDSTNPPPVPIPARVATPPVERTGSPQSYLAVRPLAELISKEIVKEVGNLPNAPIRFPKIENVVTLEPDTLPSHPSPVYPTTVESEPQLQQPFLYEEFQAEVMSKKHRIVLDAMMSKQKLVRVFKCAGRFCSFTSDSAEAALMHASTHQRVGGENSLKCAYCNFDACENAIDLVMHVFKVHSQCQYSCSLCFYRAAASQLVGAHHKRVHSSVVTPNVLRTTAFTAVAPDSNNSDDVMLTREQAVQYFICNHDGGKCMFKTFTMGKFMEHLIQKHSDAASHPCNLCLNTCSSPQELLIHMKTHEINLYQCTWCVHGADNEASLLTHVASCHPNKQPQAYIRVITNKDGNAQRRVLPLAFFNKAKVPLEDVTPSGVVENPVREAERSIELEKLIGFTSQIIENAASPQTSSVAENQTATAPIGHPLENSEEIDPSVLQTLLASDGSIVTQDREPVIKKEPEEILKLLSEPNVICLDSDDEEPVNDAPAAEPPSNTLTEDVPNNVTIADTNNDTNDASNNSATEHVTLEKLETPRSSIAEDVTLTKIIDHTVRKSLSDDDSRLTIIDLSDDEIAKKPDETSSTGKVKMEKLLKCPQCKMTYKSTGGFKRHLNYCMGKVINMPCPHAPCTAFLDSFNKMMEHYTDVHAETDMRVRHVCGVCKGFFKTLAGAKAHVKAAHRITRCIMSTSKSDDGSFVTTVKAAPSEPTAPEPEPPAAEMKKYGVGDADNLPIMPILDNPVECALCGFSTKVRLNMVRHLQLHAGRLPAPRSQPVNPVPHLETNEMHFDRMVNLASSSAGERERRPASPPPPPRYPRHVPERQRLACGAAGCSYISLDEATLRRHWDALHTSSTAFRCLHCPPDQRLDSSKPLSATRIIAHLKMHDASLYACSACSFYHFKRRAVERHAAETHRGAARALTVREEGAAPAPPPAPPAPPAQPTMDLKPWHCGLCEFESMLRPAVIEHCAAAHHSKMQFKCAYCPFRTSTEENVSKHRANAHPGRPEEIIRFYYREGSIPDDVDGIPRWRKQRQILGLPELEIKEEPEPEPGPAPVAPTAPAPAPAPAPVPAPAPGPVAVDLNIVKKEVVENPTVEMSVEDLCRKFGKFCDPNGIKYKCSLCTAVMTQTREEMRAHLFEELHYRRLGCGICSYKAYHQMGLDEHMMSDHPGQRVSPTELPVDTHIEKWVTNALDHQTMIIERNKFNFAAQAIQKEKPPPVVAPINVVSSKQTPITSETELEQAFGRFGEPRDQHFSCPKCDFLVKDETGMQNHLESELTKIRWCCTECSSKFVTYHEAQFHCKSTHGVTARPKEAIRDPVVRARWVTAVIAAQKQFLKAGSEPNTPEKNYLEPENSLLVARYDEPAPMEPQQVIPQTSTLTLAKKRPAPSSESDDDRLFIEEPEPSSVKKKAAAKSCNLCSYTTTHSGSFRVHMLKHYQMKPYRCPLCPFSGYQTTVVNHIAKKHPGVRLAPVLVPLPSDDSNVLKKQDAEDGKKVCLYCEKSVPESELETHVHDKEKPEFAKRGELVVKCLKCLELRLSVATMQEHFSSCHPGEQLRYEFFKLQVETREIHCCGHCYRKFKNLQHLKLHHVAMHSTLSMAYTSIPFNRNLHTECDSEIGKRKLGESSGPPAKRIARKSTTKLPNSAVAKKSTTKLPLIVPDSETGEFSFYGMKPLPLHEYEDVTFSMPMYNTIVDIDVKKLSGILKIDPKVVVSDCKR